MNGQCSKEEEQGEKDAERVAALRVRDFPTPWRAHLQTLAANLKSSSYSFLSQYE